MINAVAVTQNQGRGSRARIILVLSTCMSGPCKRILINSSPSGPGYSFRNCISVTLVAIYAQDTCLGQEG